MREVREILDSINETCQSDDDVRSSVSCLTLSDCGSIYYPSKPNKSPSKRLAPERQSKLFIGYHKRSKSKNIESKNNSDKKDTFNLDVEDVFLPAETLLNTQNSDIKALELDLNACQPQKIDFRRLDLYSEGCSNRENKEPNRRYETEERDELNESVVRVSVLRGSCQMSEILGASSKKGESPIRASDVFSRKGDDISLKSIDWS
mmetsp:Transcript_19638/g.17365  ORF Transcript_19638/g.17365 Transcript_19638/m.17365 type:complete len:205 (+) Transcript_19638:412-1026(+)